MEKTCRACHETKDETAFWKSPRYASGRFARCASCMSVNRVVDPVKNAERAKEWRAKHPGYMEAHNKRYYAAHKEREKSRQREWYAKNRSRAIQYVSDKWHSERKFNPDYREAATARVREYNARNRWSLRICANKAVALAVRCGAIVRQPCEVCGGIPSDAHHAKGYELAHWFTLQWLCKQHHVQIHGKRSSQDSGGNPNEVN